MADENKSSDTGSKPQPPDNKAAQDRVKLPLEERGMQVMPRTPDPQGHVEIGGLPTSEGGSGGQGEGGGSEGGGGSGDGGSSSSDSGE